MILSSWFLFKLNHHLIYPLQNFHQSFFKLHR
nr:MAG TPA: hypothetical protein [Caudoviricetes sp.]